MTTDDDVRVEQDWLDRAAQGLDVHACDYVGGKVLPIWRAPRPAWLPDRSGKQWAVIALLDYGSDPMQFGSRVPLGVNMAFRRRAFQRAGLFDLARAGRPVRFSVRRSASGASGRTRPVCEGSTYPT